MGETELLARLGLGPGASDAQLEEAHDEVVAFLERAPGGLRGWAELQIADADEAYALLGGDGGEPQRDKIRRPAPSAPAAAPPLPPVHVSRSRAAPRNAMEEVLASDGDLLGGGGGSGRSLGRSPRSQISPQSRAQDRALRRTRARTRPTSDPQLQVSNRLGVLVADPTVRRVGIVVGAVALLAIVAFAGYKLGTPGVPGITGTPAPSSASGLDLAAVNADMQKLAANSNDVVALQDLADLYYAAGDYQTSGTWIAKILKIDPSNVSALLGSGAVAFNLGDLADAESAWKAVLAIDAKNLEAHYDLGFVYASRVPPDVEKAKAEWEQVIAISPDSPAAQQARTHLATIAGSSPSPSTGAPAPSGTPASSPSATASAPSPSASGR